MVQCDLHFDRPAQSAHGAMQRRSAFDTDPTRGEIKPVRGSTLSIDV